MERLVDSLEGSGNAQKAKEMVFKLQMELVRGSVAKMGEIVGGEAVTHKADIADTPREGLEELKNTIEDQKSMINVFLYDIKRQSTKIHELESKLAEKEMLVKDFTNELHDRIQEIEDMKQIIDRQASEMVELQRNQRHSSEPLSSQGSPLSPCSPRTPNSAEVISGRSRIVSAAADWVGLVPEEKVKTIELPNIFETPRHLPTGQVVFTYLNVEGASALFNSAAQAAAKACDIFSDVRAELAAEYQGTTVWRDEQNTTFLIAFGLLRDAILFSCHIQEQLLTNRYWPKILESFPAAAKHVDKKTNQPVFSGLRVRIGIDIADTAVAKRDLLTTNIIYDDRAVERAKLLCASASGGEILVFDRVASIFEAFTKDLALLRVRSDLVGSGFFEKQQELDADIIPEKIYRLSTESMSLRLPFFINGDAYSSRVASLMRNIEDASLSGLAPRSRNVVLVCSRIDSFLSFEEYMEEVLFTYKRLVRQELMAMEGYQVSADNDRIIAAFKKPASALKFCLRVQEVMLEHEWSADIQRNKSARIRKGGGKKLFGGPQVCMGVHVSELNALVSPFDMSVSYDGDEVEGATILCCAALGGEILCSDAVHEDSALSYDVLGRPFFTSLGLGLLTDCATKREITVFQYVPYYIEERVLFLRRGIEERSNAEAFELLKNELKQERLQCTKQIAWIQTNKATELGQREILDGLEEQIKFRKAELTRLGPLGDTTDSERKLGDGEVSMIRKYEKEQELKRRTPAELADFVNDKMDINLVYKSIYRKCLAKKGPIEELEIARMQMEDDCLISGMQIRPIVAMQDLQQTIRECVITYACEFINVKPETKGLLGSHHPSIMDLNGDMPPDLVQMIQEQEAETRRKEEEVAIVKNHATYVDSLMNVHKYIKYWSECMKDYVHQFEDPSATAVTETEFMENWVQFHRGLEPSLDPTQSLLEVAKQLQCGAIEGENVIYPQSPANVTKSVIAFLQKTWVASAAAYRRQRASIVDLTETIKKASQEQIQASEAAEKKGVRPSSVQSAKFQKGVHRVMRMNDFVRKAKGRPESAGMRASPTRQESPKRTRSSDSPSGNKRVTSAGRNRPNSPSSRDHMSPRKGAPGPQGVIRPASATSLRNPVERLPTMGRPNSAKSRPLQEESTALVRQQSGSVGSTNFVRQQSGSMGSPMGPMSPTASIQDPLSPRKQRSGGSIDFEGSTPKPDSMPPVNAPTSLVASTTPQKVTESKLPGI